MWAREGTVVLELLPEEYPNLTYVTALAALGILHALYVVAGAGANGVMDVDAGSVVEALIEALGFS